MTVSAYQFQWYRSSFHATLVSFQELPQEAKRFQRIDKGWTKMMKRAYDTRNVLQVCMDLCYSKLPLSNTFRNGLGILSQHTSSLLF